MGTNRAYSWQFWQYTGDLLLGKSTPILLKKKKKEMPAFVAGADAFVSNQIVIVKEIASL